MAAFYAANGRGPRKGESIKGYASGARPAQKKGKKRKPKMTLGRALKLTWRAAKKNPIKTVVGLAVGGALVVPAGREALVNVARSAESRAKSLLPA